MGCARSLLVMLMAGLSALGLAAQSGPLTNQPSAPRITAAVVPVLPSEAGHPSAWLEVSFEIPKGLHQFLQPDYFGVRVREASLPPGWSAGPAVFPPTNQTILDLPAYQGTVQVRVPLSGPTTGNGRPFAFQAEVLWQLCYDDGVCLLPERKEIRLDVPSLATSVETVSPEPLWLMLLFGFLGGLILNFMPCVLPVLSIKALSLVRQTDRRPSLRWAHAWATTAGIVSSLLALGGAMAVLQSVGTAVGWGVQFQNPWYVVSLIAIILAFALSLFEVFPIASPTIRASQRSGLGGSFLSGLWTVVLATPCTAPFLGTALGVALASPWWIILLVFAAVGLGLALPFFLLAVIPGALAWLPQPGRWMDLFKGLMAFGLVATAIWLLTVLQAQIAPSNFSGVLWFLGLLVFTLWLYGRVRQTSWPRGTRLLAIAGLGLTLSSGGFVWLSFPEPSPARAAAAQPLSVRPNLPAPWLPFSESAAAELTRAGRPFFVDFTADWCLTCKINEAGVLASPAVLQAFASRGVTLLRGDYTNADPVIASWLRRHQRAGIPFYALVVPGRETVLLPELLTEDGLKMTLATLAETPRSPATVP